VRRTQGWVASAPVVMPERAGLRRSGVTGLPTARTWLELARVARYARARPQAAPRWRLISSAKLLLEILRLEHRIAIHWLLGNRLDDVPVFGDLAVPDPKDLDDCNTTFAGCRRHMDMQKNERTF
jgi:hypothetical protein